MVEFWIRERGKRNIHSVQSASGRFLVYGETAHGRLVSAAALEAGTGGTMLTVKSEVHGDVNCMGRA